MFFCGYCGKKYSRKEHLERHIPQHTNVKPHRCSDCQISFARKDLLHRHFETYHVAGNPTEPLPSGAAASRPIACWNCAKAKAACDKKVPCSRCEARNSECAARFARRRSKAAVPTTRACATVAGAAASTADPSPSPTPPDQRLDTPPNGPGHYVDAELHSPVPSPLHLAQKMVDSADELDMCLPLETISSQHGCGEASEELMLDGFFDYFMAANMDPNLSYLDMPVSRLVSPLTATAELSNTSSGPMPATTSTFQGVLPLRGTFALPSDELQKGKNDKCISFVSHDAIPELEEVSASEAAWPLTCCTPPIFSGSCPRTALLHLACLEQKPKQEGTWSALEQDLKSQSHAAGPVQVVPLTSHSRDKMVAITQSSFSKALDFHRSALYSKSRVGSAAGQNADFNFIQLPPLRILDIFLRNCIHSLATYYPLIEGDVMDPNEMLESSQASPLLVLLMIAQGAATVPVADARHLSAGLSEICRIAIFDILDKNASSDDLTALHCALLSTHLGAWSGDKWQMDIAMRQCSMYLRMLKPTGILEPQSLMTPTLGIQTCADEQRRIWLRRESQSRLVYNWVMVDQELSLFHDTTPVLSASDAQCPLPSSNALWPASSGSQMQGPHPPMPSLCQLFQEFLHGNLARRRDSLSPQQFRLLLHPLQSLLYHSRQILSYMPDRSLSKVSTVQRFEEVQALLQAWYKLSTDFSRANPDCDASRCNLVLYHLISLNAVTNFPEVERLARREGFDESDCEVGLRHKRCILQREEALFNCGQVMRLLRQMPVDCRPSWWSVALYRALLILWADSICHLDSRLSTLEGHGSGNDNGILHNSETIKSLVAIDQITPEDQATIDHLLCKDGIPVLTRIDHSYFTLKNPPDILGYGIQRIQEAVSTRISDGIHRKLLALASNWDDEGHF